MAYQIEIRPLSFLRRSEEIDELAAASLAGAIEGEGAWLAPIPVERRTGIVMDGNHRLHAAGLLALTHVPCILLDYADPQVSVSCWRTGQPYDVARIFLEVLCWGRLLPYKTTRHAFAPGLPRSLIALSMLRHPDGLLPVSRI
ncbi:transcriptional regulator (plasmid) [Burkholderia glumae]|uniref:ParB N-terminal domain-containing protein n=1 Tax=Burkholderia glumae TaxID=337 RepID=UPI002151A414|nr:ParB N-terminal domain-containing protein [Burkholderia glumae]UVS82792.1 transcriptional regulator [Burkholderia glumae]UVT00237.1 transcriptional regulator [Burkholderia glumae]